MGKYGKCQAGTAVMAYVIPDMYSALTGYAIVSFIASMSVVRLAISGLPLKNKLFTRLMTIAMIIAITSLSNTFAFAIAMVVPDPIIHKIEKIINITGFIWISLIGTTTVFGAVRLLFCLVRYLSKLRRFVRKRNQGPIC